jgi:hypothetical protein
VKKIENQAFGVISIVFRIEGQPYHDFPLNHESLVVESTQTKLVEEEWWIHDHYHKDDHDHDLSHDYAYNHNFVEVCFDCLHYLIL